MNKEYLKIMGITCIFGIPSTLFLNCITKKEITRTDNLKIFSTFPLFISPSIFIINKMNDYIIPKITIENYYLINKKIGMKLKCYFYNKRFMAYDILVNNLLIQNMYFLIFNKYYLYFIREKKDEDNKFKEYNLYRNLNKYLFNFLIFNYIIEIGTGYYYENYHKLNKTLLNSRLIVKICWYSVIWNLIINQDLNKK